MKRGTRKNAGGPGTESGPPAKGLGWLWSLSGGAWVLSLVLVSEAFGLDSRGPSVTRILWIGSGISSFGLVGWLLCTIRTRPWIARVGLLLGVIGGFAPGGAYALGLLESGEPPLLAAILGGAIALLGTIAAASFLLWWFWAGGREWIRRRPAAMPPITPDNRFAKALVSLESWVFAVYGVVAIPLGLLFIGASVYSGLWAGILLGGFVSYVGWISFRIGERLHNALRSVDRKHETRSRSPESSEVG